MPNPADQVVTVKLKFVSDDVDVRQSYRRQAEDARKLAGDQAKLNAALRAGRSPWAGGGGSPGGPAGADWAAGPEAQIEALRRQRVLGSLYSQRQQEMARQEQEKLAASPLRARLRGESLYEQRAGELATRRRESAGFTQYMADRGLTTGGGKLPVERGVIGRGLEAVGGRLGLPAGMGATLGQGALLAAPVIAGKMALDQYAQARQIYAQPFLSAGAAREQKLRGLPLGAGRAYGYYEDTRAAVSGDLDVRRASAEYRVMETERTRLTGSADLRQQDYNSQTGSLRNRADAFSTLSLDRRQGFDQTTVRGQQQSSAASSSTTRSPSCCRPSGR